jgi:hypothetical protein
MRISTVVALGAVSLWALSSAGPANAGTVHSESDRSSVVSGFNGQNLDALSFNNSPSSFNPTSGSYVFEISDNARVVSYDSACSGDGDPIIVRGTGGGGSKHRHSAPTTSGPCRHDASSGSAVTLDLHAMVGPAIPSCPDGAPPDGRPIGGGGGKRRHPAPLGKTPCRPRQDSPFPSRPAVLGMSVGPDAALGSYRGPGPDEATAGPAGGSGGKHRHSPPTAPPTRPPDGAPSPSTPEPSGLILLGSGALGLAALLRSRRASRRSR